MAYVKRGIIPIIASELNLHRRTIQNRIVEKRSSLANLYSPTVCAFAYAHEQGLDLSHLMNEEELTQVKEIMGTGLRLIRSDHKIKNVTEKVSMEDQIKDTINLKQLLGEIKRESKNNLATSLFNVLIDHSRIKHVSTPHWNNKQYRSAVLDSLIELENMVKEKAGYPKNNRGHELGGTRLMHKVFDVNTPMLKWSNLESQVLRDELEGYKHLFVGAIMGIRNPKAHLVFRQRPWRALQLLVFANLLAELVDLCDYYQPASS